VAQVIVGAPFIREANEWARVAIPPELLVYTSSVPTGLKRYYGANDLHFITFSCYRRQQFLATASRRDSFLRILEEVRRKYDFLLVGFSEDLRKYEVLTVNQLSSAKPI
jgi:hypothetical protein